MLENKLFEALLDVIPFKAYATDIKTFEVVYANKMMRENMFAPQETYCWEKVFGQEEICSWCSIIDLELLEKENAKQDKHIVEFFDETDDKWLKSYDELMSWPDGRKVKYSILVDITDQKEIQGSMIKSHATMAMKNKQMTETNKKLQITKLKLQKSVGEFEQLLNATMEGLLIFEDALCKDINTQALDFFNCKNKDKAIGNDFLDFVSDNFKEIAAQNITLETPWECELLKKDGTTFPALIKNSFLTSSNRVVSIIDLSDLKQKEKEIQEQKKMVALGELIGNIAHQWRQPLSVISTAASGMELQKEMGVLTDDNFSSNCNSIVKTTEYLSKTIEEFRILVDNDDKKSIFNLTNVIHNFLNVINTSSQNNNIKIDLDLDNNIEIDGHKNKLIQCLINMYHNTKDAFEDKTIDAKFFSIKTSVENEKVIIKVKDNAGGIPQDVLPKIFEPYFTTKHQTQGTGLGLHMTYNLIVEDMNGNIKVSNVEFKYEDISYKGTEFTIEL